MVKTQNPPTNTARLLEEFPESDVRQRVAIILSMMENPSENNFDAIRSIVEKSKSPTDESPRVMQEAGYVMASFGTTASDAYTTKILKARIHSNAPQLGIAYGIIDRLAKRDEKAKAILLLAAMSEDPEVRLTVVSGLIKVDPGVAVPVLENALSDIDLPVARRALDLLSGRILYKFESAQTALAAVASGKVAAVKEVQLGAIEALGAIHKKPEIKDLLSLLLISNDPEIKAAAESAFRR